MKMHLSRNSLHWAFPDAEGPATQLLPWLLLPDWPWIQRDVRGASRTTGTRRAEGGLQQPTLPIQCVALHIMRFFSSTLGVARGREMFVVLPACAGLLIPSCHSRKGSWNLWLQNHYWIIQLPAVISQSCGPNPKLSAVSDQSPGVNHAPSVLVGWLFVYAKCWVNM